MKRVIVVVLVVALVMIFMIPIAFADQPANPGCVGENVSTQGKAGTRNDVVAGILGGGNLGHAIQAWKGPACGLPAGH